MMLNTITPDELIRIIVSSRSNNKDNLLRYVLRKNTQNRIEKTMRALVKKNKN